MHIVRFVDILVELYGIITTLILSHIYSRYLSVLHGMNIRVRQLLVNVEPELRARLEKRVMEMAIGAHQEALNSADKSQPHDLSEPRVGSPPPSTEHSQIVSSPL